MGGQDVVGIMLQYAISRGEVSKPDEFQRIIREQVSPKIEESVMSLAQIWKQEGRQEGRLEGVRDTAYSLLLEGANPGMVSRCTGLSLAEVYALHKKISEPEVCN